MINKIDSAYVNLMRLAEKTDYLDCTVLENQTEFQSIKLDARWKRIKNLTCGSDKGLTDLFSKIYYSDQNKRSKIDSIGKNFGYGSQEMKSIWKVISFNDSIDLIKIDSIYNIYGWPDPELVSKKGCQTFYLVIQHSALSVQEKYLPLMQKAVAEGKAEMKNCAYLEDRVLMGNKKPQKYGSQFAVMNKTGKRYLYPLQDKDNVNKLREEIGLPPLSQEDIDSSVRYYEENK